MYGPIAALWDKYLESDEVRSLPTRLRSPLTALYADISNTANKHFDAFIKGSHPPSHQGEHSYSCNYDHNYLSSGLEPPFLLTHIRSSSSIDHHPRASQLAYKPAPRTRGTP